ncbi:MAG: UDP-N-acetylglucosamine 2-epimerase (non-hydrolyzing) [Solirubrobacteraceae bacterium]|nr:UDP-N-acetylglucosamine 2-epimerase (non-hydrolyzing) [Solirubrobacteraceae bacterium]
MRVVTVIGNRPQFVKAAAVSPLLRASHEEIMVHTGQHHDDELSQVFVDQLGAPQPEHQLHIHGGSNTDQSALMLGALGPLLDELDPDAVLVYGDTNSTLAGGIAAAQKRIPLVHVEAGLRSFDRAMPEELNRVLIDHAADLLLPPTEASADQLRKESVAGAIEVVGDVMIDVAHRTRPAAEQAGEALLAELTLARGEFAVSTLHRAGNVDTKAQLSAALDVLASIGLPVVLPLHPRTAARLEQFDLRARAEEELILLRPLGYLEFSGLIINSAAVLTDSGGVQKEAYVAGVRCITLRDTTEWTETVDVGWNTLVALDATAAQAAMAADLPAARPELYGDGHAAERVVSAVERLVGG